MSHARYILPADAAEHIRSAQVAGARFGEHTPLLTEIPAELVDHVCCEHPLCGFYASKAEAADRTVCPRCIARGRPEASETELCRGKLIPLDAAACKEGRLLLGEPGLSRGDLLTEQRAATAAAQKAQKLAEQQAARAIRDANLAKKRLDVAKAQLAAAKIEPDPALDV